MNELMKKICITLLLVPLLLVVILYLTLVVYYQSNFQYGTWVNNVYCTGLTIEEINQELINGYQPETVTIETIDGEIYKLLPESIDDTVDFSKPLTELLGAQNSLLWGVNLFQSEKHIMIPTYSFDKSLVKKAVEEWIFMEESSNEKTFDVAIIKTDKGYQLEDNSKNILKTEEVVDKVITAIASGEKTISLEQEQCYYNLPVTTEMEEVYKLWDKVEAFQSFEFSYEFGSEIEKVDEKVLAEWMITSEDGTIMLDETGEIPWDTKKAEEYISSLAVKYDTYNIPRTITTTEGRNVTIEKGNYGNQLDQKLESEYLLEAFESKKNEIRTPEYKHKALYQGLDDIGDTYIEIDMTYQKMYYYHEGELVIETPVVTGNESRRMLTPAKVCFVYFKQLDRVLIGKDYRTPVDYWMAVNGNIGIHDANWRDEFGDEIYKTNGSHGCINTPPDQAAKMYDLVEEGTPVLMYY